MAISVVSRWDIPREDAQRITRDLAPLLKNNGAESVRLGRITTGNNAGQTTTIVTYADFETYGRAMQTLQNDQKYRTLRDERQKVGKLRSRNVVVTDEL